MDKIITIEEVKLIDQLTYQKISEIELIKKVGLKLFQFLHDKLNGDILIIAGPGNNGADSLALGYHLLDSNVKFLVCDRKSDYFLERLIENNAKIYYLDNDYDSLIANAEIIIDGIFGTGLNREVTGKYYNLISKINQSQAKVYAIDIPSGINGDNGLVQGIAVNADLTLVIEDYKVGNLLNDAFDYHGQIKVIKIGLAPYETSRYLLSKPSLRPRKINTHKYHYGSILGIAGQMAGAAVMSALAALRSGSGLVTIAAFSKYRDSFKYHYPEIIIQNFQDRAQFEKLLSKKDAIVFGPGLGTDEDHLALLEKIINFPLIVDADGLKFLKQVKSQNLPNLIITPHSGELAEIFGVQSNEIIKDPLKYLEKFIERYNCTVVYKGPCTIIANKEEMFFAPCPNPGLATAGSGDVLSGIIASFLGRGFTPLTSAKLGVYIHQQAGLIARAKVGEESLIASDIINALPQAIQDLKKW